MLITFAVGGIWNLDIASLGEGLSLSLVNAQSSAVNHLAQALWPGAGHGAQLCAARGGRGGGGVAVVEARRHAHHHVGAVIGLRRRAAPKRGRH